MSYAAARALQEAVFARLSAEPGLAGRVFDHVPHGDGPGAVSGLHVTLGDERVEAWGARGLEGAVHEIEIGVHGPEDGFAQVKDAAAAVVAALEGPLAPAAGRVVTAGFLGARARRVAGGRRIDLRFRFRIEM